MEVDEGLKSLKYFRVGSLQLQPVGTFFLFGGDNSWRAADFETTKGMGVWAEGSCHETSRPRLLFDLSPLSEHLAPAGAAGATLLQLPLSLCSRPGGTLMRNLEDNTWIPTTAEAACSFPCRSRSPESLSDLKGGAISKAEAWRRPRRRSRRDARGLGGT